MTFALTISWLPFCVQESVTGPDKPEVSPEFSVKLSTVKLRRQAIENRELNQTESVKPVNEGQPSPGKSGQRAAANAATSGGKSVNSANSISTNIQLSGTGQIPEKFVEGPGF